MCQICVNRIFVMYRDKAEISLKVFLAQTYYERSTIVWGEIMRVVTEWVIWSKKSIDVSNTLMYVSIQYWLRFTPNWLWLDEHLVIINGITFVAIKSWVGCYPSLTIPFITRPGRDFSELEISNRK